MKIKILELFGGIGACSKALEKLEIDYEIVDYVEIDKYAVASFNAIHNTHFEPQDVCKWDKDIEVDLIMHGSPCQDFSLAGLQAGGDKNSGTRSSLMYETIRIVKKLKPKYVIWENVKNLLSKKHIHNFTAYLDELDEIGYKNYYQVLNAKDYGIPQNRERVFTISIRKDIDIDYVFPPKQELKLRLKDFLENNVDEKYYLSEEKINQIVFNDPIKENEFMPKVLAGVGKKDSNSNTQWKQQNRIYDNKIASAITTMYAPYYMIKNATRKGYIKVYEGDGICLEQPNSKTRRGRVQKNMIQTLDTQCTKGVIVKNSQEMTLELIKDVTSGKYNNGNVYGKHLFQSSRFNDKPQKNISATIKAGNMDAGVINGLRVRKLTPKECWRLMGFGDEDFEKASKVSSNAQLYKQAGNSIVVNVLEAILRNLLLDEKAKGTQVQTTIFDFI